TIESDGILKGSYKNERRIRTTANTGQKSYAHVIMKFSLSLPRVCLCLKTSLSNNHTKKKTSVAGTRIKLKSKSMGLYPQSYYLSTFNTARNASCGISTLPTCFMRFLPSFCLDNSFFLRETSPP